MKFKTMPDEMKSCMFRELKQWQPRLQDNFWLKLESVLYLIYQYPSKEVKTLFNSVNYDENLGVVVHLVKNTQNLVILRCFGKKGKEMWLVIEPNFQLNPIFLSQASQNKSYIEQIQIL